MDKHYHVRQESSQQASERICYNTHLWMVHSIRINQVTVLGSSGMHQNQCHRIKIAVQGNPRMHSSAKYMN